jgi:NADP-reducing hydrogenase subunit HndD
MPFATTSGAGVIFGVTGGVTEAVLRRVSANKSRTGLLEIANAGQRGNEGVKEFTLFYGERELKIAVVSGLGNADDLLERIKAGEHYDFIEIMACPGGCVNGGGQPHQPAEVRETVDLRAVRAAVLYNDDANADLRKSHENSAVKKLYDEYFGEPNSHKAHEILHTHYVKRGL